MKYFVSSFKIECPTELLQTARDLLADAAGEAGFESFEDTDDGINGYVQKDFFDKEILEQGINDFPLNNVSISYVIKDAEDKDWNEEWENTGFEPIIVANRVIIYDAKKTTPDELQNITSKINGDGDGHQCVPIGIEAKLAFGTGSHQTTRMIVAALLKLNLKGKRFLDCGCGTGILGITAAKLGASEIVGYDIDEWSVENARHNAKINGVDNFNDYHGDSTVLNHVSGVFDVVAANINRNILLKDMHSFKDVMQHGGILILSGFYQEDIPTILDKASEFNLHEQQRYIDDNWSCIVLI